MLAQCHYFDDRACGVGSARVLFLVCVFRCTCLLIRIALVSFMKLCVILFFVTFFSNVFFTLELEQGNYYVKEYDQSRLCMCIKIDVSLCISSLIRSIIIHPIAINLFEMLCVLLC